MNSLLNWIDVHLLGKKPFYWHIHHEILVETLEFPVKKRIEHILGKPWYEQPRRLRLFKPIKSRAAQQYMRRAYSPDMPIFNADQFIEEWHRQECPSCPWNGKTIFPELSDRYYRNGTFTINQALQ